ncbi:MAG: glutamine amidotransferase [Rhodobacteraceae bacterium]|nr:glutamine amidotransferase [Paracoccaceae bacterium]
MCGIVGLFLKDKALEVRLGSMLSDMLITMSDRGPDSAGIAIYRKHQIGRSKITVQSEGGKEDYLALQNNLSTALGVDIAVEQNDTHAIIDVENKSSGKLRSLIELGYPNIRIMSEGDKIEIYKEVGLPSDVTERFKVSEMAGSHAVGHTRMATESAVTTNGAHPYSTGADQCLVHNGSLSNHNSLRRKLTQEGIRIESENDTEVGAAYLTWKMAAGFSLGEALESSLGDLDGFFTFVVATKDGFGVLRDPIACKPAVLAETDQFVAFGSEYRALVKLPGIETARVWEPEPATVYFWSY